MKEKPIGFDQRIEHSISLLKRAEKIALRYSDDGFYLAFSGGKDSQALYHLAELAGVKFKAHYSMTTIDPPEVVRFIRRNYPDVVWDKPKMPFFKTLLTSKRILPTYFKRWCCAEYKENGGAGMVTLTGVRRAESRKRAERNEAEKLGRKFSGTLDEFMMTKEVEDHQCIKGKDKIIINPIIEWTDDDVWFFLDEIAKVEHCELYDQGWERVGCLFCPMARKSEKQMMTECYPKFKSRFITVIDELFPEDTDGWRQVRKNRYKGLTAEHIFAWWQFGNNAPLDEWIRRVKPAMAIESADELADN